MIKDKQQQGFTPLDSSQQVQPRRTSLFKSLAGFTILEVVVTITLVGFVIIGLTTLLTTLSNANDRARDLALANAFAEQKGESLRSAGFIALEDEVVDFTDELPDTFASPRSATYTISEASVEDEALANVKQVDIQISYTNYGQTTTLEYQTLIGELGVGQY